MRPRLAAALGAAVLLLACGRAPTAERLQLPAEDAGFGHVLVRAAWSEDRAPDANRTDAAVARAMHQRKIRSSGSFWYLPKDGEVPHFKVRIDVFADTAAAMHDWDHRHLPQTVALLQPLALPGADQAWIFRNQMAGFRVGPAIVEVRAEGKVPLEEFTRKYAAHVAGELPAGD